MVALLFWMPVLHAICDYPLQGDFLAKAKNRTAPVPGVPWWQALTAHAAIHAGAIGLVTGSVWLALGELIAHWLTDDAKCRGQITFNQDQAIHVACKVTWALLSVLGVA